MINSKIIDAYYIDDDCQDLINNEDFLEKGQIELVLDDCPRFIIQFEDLTSWLDWSTCIACEQQLECLKLNDLEKLIKTSQDFDLFMKKYNKVKQSKDTNEIKNTKCTCSNSNDSDDDNNNNNSNNLKKLKCKICSNQSNETNFTLNATKSDLINTISNLIGCIGCRTSLERFYRQQANKLLNSQKKLLKKNFSHIIYPILILLNDKLTLHNSILNNPFKLYFLFYINFSKVDLKLFKINNLLFSQNNSNLISKFHLNSTINSNLPNNLSNKNRRCQIHSLDKNRQKSLNDWLIVWDSFTKNSSRTKTLLIDTSKLQLTLDNYLRRHKFCSDCKLKVIRAYNILTGELDPSKEKGYCSNLFTGIEFCTKTKPIIELINNTSTNKKQTRFHLNKPHLHLKNDKQFIGNLIYKAEPDIQGGRRERHAKTIDIAQEEVLTCIGIHLYEKFYRIYQSIKLEEQTWNLLVYSSILTLKKAFELKFEKLQGISNIDLICAELEAELDQEEKCSKSYKKKSKSKNKNKKSKKQLNNENKESSEINKIKLVNNSEIDNLVLNVDDYCDYLENSTSSSSNYTKSHNGDLEEFEEDKENLQVETIEILLNNNQSLNQTKYNHENDEPICKFLSDEESQIKKNDQLMFFTSLTSSSSSSSSSANLTSNYELNELNSNLIDCLSITQNTNSIEDSYETDDLLLITDEEKNEYYANKTVYLNERKNRREMLREKFQNFKFNSSFKIRPRNVS